MCAGRRSGLTAGPENAELLAFHYRKKGAVLFSKWFKFARNEPRPSPGVLAQHVVCCTRARSPKSACRRCLDACPAGAVHIEGQAVAVDADLCSGCGLCAAACPNNALKWDSPSLPELHKEISLRAPQSSVFYLACSQSPAMKADVAHALLPCLGLPGPEFWQLLLEDVPNAAVFLPAGACAACACSRGGEIFRAKLGQAESLSGKRLPIAEARGELRISRKTRAVDQSRRRLFGSLVQRVEETREREADLVREFLSDSGFTSAQQRYKAYLQSLDPDGAGGNQGSESSLAGQSGQVTDRRVLLLRLLRRHPRYAAQLTMTLPVIDQERCRMCKACVFLCLFGCLFLSGPEKITLDPRACTGCGLCADVCLYKAIEMRDLTASSLAGAE